MTLPELQRLAEELPGVTTDIKWEDHLCFNMGEKLFLITAPDQVPVSASFKVSAHRFEQLIDREGVIPAPYLARYKWVQTDDIERFSHAEWNELVQESYSLIAAGLSAKKRKELGIR